MQRASVDHYSSTMIWNEHVSNAPREGQNQRPTDHALAYRLLDRTKLAFLSVCQPATCISHKRIAGDRVGEALESAAARLIVAAALTSLTHSVPISQRLKEIAFVVQLE
jgi:hypothetical protein